MLRLFIGCANFPGQAAGFIFERADTEISGGAAIHEVFADERFEPAAALALRDVHELVQEQFGVLPAIRANNDSVADGHAAGGIGNYLSVPRGVGEFLVLGERNAIDHQDADPGRILNAGPPRIGNLPGSERTAVFEDNGFLLSRPFTGKGAEAFEFFLVDHMLGEMV